LLDQFVTTVLATTNIMWAAANFDEINMEESLGIVADDLHTEALYVRRRLDREAKEHWAKLVKEHPELGDSENKDVLAQGNEGDAS
ncbi:MAG: hypothetical protein IID41_10545, partial [Planctomycetes bacterium]|nr:hypothetical protein [Planctomycetota bacterium]